MKLKLSRLANVPSFDLCKCKCILESSFKVTHNHLQRSSFNLSLLLTLKVRPSTYLPTYLPTYVPILFTVFDIGPTKHSIFQYLVTDMSIATTASTSTNGGVKIIIPTSLVKNILFSKCIRKIAWIVFPPIFSVGDKIFLCLCQWGLSILHSECRGFFIVECNVVTFPSDRRMGPQQKCRNLLQSSLWK